MAVRHTRLWHDIVGVFLPRCCAACGERLYGHESALCTSCLDDLPRLRDLDDPDNKVEAIFRGRVRLAAAAAFLQFTKDGMVQQVLHRLKYGGDTGVGLELGRLMAKEAMQSRRYADVDLLLAVPLHRKRMRQRGYNQAQVLVDGMLEEWGLAKVDIDLLRVVHTSTQTRRGRMARWGNVKAAFRLADPEVLRGKHVLLVDDVVTTGATLEGCALALADVPGIRISVLACACA
ncbi:MAG: ComF family protein [Flavobacteriales bacterium]|nr:ComF family protein [Flavobacteriales bacterium]MEB2342685.1 phosphoribosyltransferase family protein [Flavobacteriia bacterium]